MYYWVDTGRIDSYRERGGYRKWVLAKDVKRLKKGQVVVEKETASRGRRRKDNPETIPGTVEGVA